MNIFNDTLFRGLEKLNYSVNESKIYLTLIKLGPSLAGEVAKEAHLDRSSTYNALNALIQRGVVSTVHENKRTIFVPEDPKKILNYFQEKEEIAKKLIPKLQDRFAFQKKRSTVKLFKGYKGLKTIFEDILDSEEGSSYSLLGTEGYFTKRMPYYAPLFLKMKDKKKINSRLLIREERAKKKLKNWKYTQYKTVPSDVESPATITIYQDKVAIFIWEEDPQAILIENEKVNRTFLNYFNFMWKKTNALSVKK